MDKKTYLFLSFASILVTLVIVNILYLKASIKLFGIEKKDNLNINTELIINEKNILGGSESTLNTTANNVNNTLIQSNINNDSNVLSLREFIASDSIIVPDSSNTNNIPIFVEVGMTNTKQMYFNL